jgi:peptidoglycan/xylan/chitin deacetylase (PgdA/CDA1 family)
LKKVNLIISIDTECDRYQNWEVRQPLSFQNIEDQKTTLFPLFKKHGIKATYLISPEVLKNDAAMRVFEAVKGDHEFGSHLHVEFIEPEANMQSAWAKGVQAELAPELEYAKLDQLTKIFKKRFGYQPLSFRAGRFGASPVTLRHLADLGYKVDSSLKPYSRLKFKNDVLVDTWGIFHWPYFPDIEDYKRKSKQRKILELPVTLVQPRLHLLNKKVVAEMGSYKHPLRKVFRKIKLDIGAQWLRPQRHGLNQLLRISDWVVKNTPKNQVPVLNMMFHSSELTPGTSPYCATEEDVAEYLNTLDQYFSHLKNNYEVCSIGLGEAYGSYA